MADSRFFRSAGPLSVNDLAALTGATVVVSGGDGADGKRVFAGVAPLDRAGADEVSFLDNTKYLGEFAASQAGACFVRPQFAARARAGMILLLTKTPYTAYALTAQRFYPEPSLIPGISPLASVAAGAQIGEGVRIDAGAVIGEGAVIGARCHIAANAVIGDGVEIGSDSRIGPLCGISHAIIGRRVIVHRGAQIGQDGFGFAPGKTGIAKVPQLGRVLIGDDVEIGANSCIDRGAGPDTVIGDGCKIDNLVQIGHNVRLGKCVIITGQCGISGSTQIGDGAMLGAQSGMAGHLSIGACAKLAARAGVMTDIPPGETWGGTPAVPMRDWHRQTLALRRLAVKKGMEE